MKQPENIRNYKNIAVIKFDSPDPVVSYKMTEKISVRFANRGFNVLDRGKLKKLADEDALIQSGVSDPIRTALAGIGITGLVFGNVEKYDCESQKAWTWTGMSPERTTKEDCSAVMSVKLVDINSGEVIWKIRKSHSEYAEDMTAQTVLGIVLAEIEEEMPEIQQ